MSEKLALNEARSACAGWIEAKLAGALQKMVGVRNLAVHEFTHELG